MKSDMENILDKQPQRIEKQNLKVVGTFAQVLAEWRDRLIHSLCRGAVVVGLFTLIPSLIESIIAGDVLDGVLSGLAYLIVIIAAFVRMPYRLRAWLLLFDVYLLSINSLLLSGLRADARVYLTALAPLALMLFGYRGAIFSFILDIITMVGMGWLIVSERYVLENTYGQLDPLFWITAGAVILLISFVLFLGINLLLREFESTSQRERDLYNGLLGERASLERRVEDATRDLALAAEVGQRLSLMRDPDTMLLEAVELIRDRFDMYYTQVYLLDPTGRSLVLRAGTGAAGQTLLRRGHRLPVDLVSINGTVAAERQPVIVEDTETSARHRPNPLLPDTRSELAVPLIAGDRVVGVLDLQSDRAGALREENLPAFEALAGQFAITIINAELFVEAERARQNVEAQARRLTREGWFDFLDGIQQRERVGFSFDQKDVQPLEKPLAGILDEAVLVTPIQVAGEPVGVIQLEGQESWAQDDVEMVDAVAQQVAQQVENLRLIAQADRYRADAQNALRRLTREGWQAYQKQSSSSYVYADHQVKSISAAEDHQDETLQYEINVQDEAIGHIGVAGLDALSDEGTELIASVSEQLSAHIENLRLSEQTEQALADTEEQASRLSALTELSAELGQSENLEEIFGVAARRLNHILPADRTCLTRLTEDGENLEVFDLQDEAGVVPTGTMLPLEGTATGMAVREMRPVLVPDLTDTEYLENAQLARQGFRSTLAVPLVVSGKGIGTLNIESTALNAYSVTDQDLALQAASLVASTIENQNLLEQTRTRAAELATVAEVSTTASTVLDPDELLQAVVDLTKAQFDLYHTHIYLYDEAWNMLMLAAGAGEIGREMVAEGWNIPLDSEQSLVAQAARNREGVIVNDVRTEPGFLPNPHLPDTRSEMAVPMIAGDQVLGVLDVQSESADRFTDDDIRIQITLASQVAVALQNSRLYAEQEATVAQLRELDHLKSSFLANMSHELRTPLNSVLGFTEIILEGIDGPLTEAMETDLGVIYNNGQHLLNLINDVLDMAKIEAGRMNLTPEYFHLHELLTEVVDITNPMAQDKSLYVKLETKSTEDLFLEADRIRMRQVLLNLVNNAIKFTDKGGITIKASKSNGNMKISVCDTGIGISPEKSETIFEAFGQVDTTTTRKAGGTGLGLPISLQLVELHSGKLWVESSGKPGEGSIFYVDLPVESSMEKELT